MSVIGRKKMMKGAAILVFLAFFVLFAFGKGKKDTNWSEFTEGTLVGSETCMTCHDDPDRDLSGGYHAENNNDCEACHGGGSIHADSGDPKDILTFKDEALVDAVIYSSKCLTCHAKNKEVMYYKASAHFSGAVACTSCHTVHTKRATEINSTIAQPYYDSIEKGHLKKQELDLCYSCHSEIMAKSFYPSHHPIREGKITCKDCHNSHGGVLGMLKTKTRPNDLCLECHPDKRGPFAFEHSPVEEDCTICHDPHGTTAFKLLKNAEPFLCLQCHHNHFQSKEHKDFQYSTSVKCTQCHIKIHGSNYPSHASGFGGRALTR